MRASLLSPLSYLLCAFAAHSDLAVADAALDAAASSSSSPICLLPLERQEWRVLNDTQKEDYIRPILPWHRRFVALYESTLRSECGYEGAQPYWDWTLDADTGTITNSPIFDPVHGFGGNGAFIEGWRGFFGNLTTPPGSGGGCIQDGPFKTITFPLGLVLVTNHCISRAINDNLVQYMTTAQFLNTTNQPTFELFRQEIGGAFKPPPLKIHDGGHGGVNGEMGTYSQALVVHPLFFLHHAALDRVWAIWQDFNPSV
ncbi:hypothetical protein C8J56DRAFT_968947, partial [Mycena floridula]